MRAIGKYLFLAGDDFQRIDWLHWYLEGRLPLSYLAITDRFVVRLLIVWRHQPEHAHLNSCSKGATYSIDVVY